MSWLDGEAPPPADEDGKGEDGGTLDGEFTYILNTNSKKIHLPNCSSAASTKPENKATTSKTKDELIDDGYTPCNVCKP